MTRFRPWILVVIVFTGLAAAYFAAFHAAREAQIKDVPLASQGGRP